MTKTPSKQSSTSTPDTLRTQLRKFTSARPRPLPVIVLADVSGSMRDDGKIQALNHALKEMIESLRDESDLRAEIQIGVITFGRGGAREHVPLAPMADVTWTDMPADGATPLDAALRMATALVEDRDRIPSRAYRPTLVLVSDGQPTDGRGHRSDHWKTALADLLRSERASKCQRFALAIGADADREVLQEFLGDSGEKVRGAEAAKQIRDFFRFVTMSVTARSQSIDPNTLPMVLDAEFDV